MKRVIEQDAYINCLLAVSILLSTIFGTLIALGLPSDAKAIPPLGYYSNVDPSNPAALRRTLHMTIDDHMRYLYSSDTETDTWDILELADEDPNDPGYILDLYKNESYLKAGGGNSDYNREHTWPKSMGFPIDDDSGENSPYTDCHMLFLSNMDYNNSRSRNPYRYCNEDCEEFFTVSNNGQGGGRGIYPGNSNWRNGLSVSGTWETWSGRRGDVARALFYADLRYEGGVHGVTGFAEPDLSLCDDQAMIASTMTGANEPVAYMGMLSVLLSWHYEDPVDQLERNRNDVIFAFQGNRNPFVDHPEWVSCIYEGVGCQCECITSADCDDLDACTTDECINGSCEHTPIICETDEICEDGICMPFDPCGG